LIKALDAKVEPEVKSWTCTVRYKLRILAAPDPVLGSEAIGPVLRGTKRRRTSHGAGSG